MSFCCPSGPQPGMSLTAPLAVTVKELGILPAPDAQSFDLRLIKGPKN